LRNYAKIIEPLRNLLEKDVKLYWSDECEKAFQLLKHALTNPSVLLLPDFSKSFKLTTDASISRLGFEISQVDHNGQEHPVAFGVSRATHQQERNFGITELELLSLICGVKQYRTFFVNNTFEVVTDHLCLKYLKKNATGA
jgi:hypothetical protein